MKPDEDWKTFFLRHKWIPTSFLQERFGLERHDIDNFRRKPSVRQLLDPWRVRIDQDPVQLAKIFLDAWQFYIQRISGLILDPAEKTWVPDILGLRNLSRDPNGLGFLSNSDYYEIMCPDAVKDFREHGFTNIALGTHVFWPGKAFLRRSGILPYMFKQTHRKALEYVNVDDMIEHVYLSFIAPSESGNTDFAKEVFLARWNEPGFLPAETLAAYGVPYNFYSSEGGLRMVLERLCDKYRQDLGLTDASDTSWSSLRFRKLHPDKPTDRCRYCGLAPVDLHHLLPRSDYPELTFSQENVVPLCIQIHGLISRNQLSYDRSRQYKSAIIRWRKAAEGTKVSHFDQIMIDLHNDVYGFTSSELNELPDNKTNKA